MRLRFSSPVVLIFCLLSVSVLILSDTLGKTVLLNFFVAGDKFEFADPISYIRLFSYTLGHANWSHLAGNLTFILLLGPILEEKYGSVIFLIMILITAAATAIVNILLFSSGIVGASGVVFMLIILSSFANAGRKEIPLTFVVLAGIFFSQEVFSALQPNNISHFAHIAGGVCGGIFGFYLNQR